MGGIFSPAAQMVGWPQQPQNTAPVVIAAPTGTAGPQPPPGPPKLPIGSAVDFSNETPEERARRLARMNSVLGGSDGGSGGEGGNAGVGGNASAASTGAEGSSSDGTL